MLPISPVIRNQRGIALLYLIIMFTLLGVLVSAGVRQFGATVAAGKIKDTKTELERDAQIITAWAIRKGRLPASIEYAEVFGTTPPLDGWGRQIGYRHDADLSETDGTGNVSKGGLCGKTGVTGQEVAFLLISGGEDMNITSNPSITGGSLTGLTPDADLYRIVTLNELQAQAGCGATTQGRLRILNNELPIACKFRGYSATVFGVGGVGFLSYTSFQAPAIKRKGKGLYSSYITDDEYTIDVRVTDENSSSVQRRFVLGARDCPP